MELLDSSYFEQVVRDFMSRREALPLSPPIAVDSDDGPLDLDRDTFRICPRCPSSCKPSETRTAMLCRETHHFNNHRVGQRLSVTFHYTIPREFWDFVANSSFKIGSNISDYRRTEWIWAEHSVDSRICMPRASESAEKPLFQVSSVLLDVFGCLSRYELEKCQLVSRFYDGVVAAQSNSLPTHRLAMASLRRLDGDCSYSVFLYRCPSNLTQSGGGALSWTEPTHYEVRCMSANVRQTVMRFIRSTTVKELRINGAMDAEMADSLLGALVGARTAVSRLTIVPPTPMHESVEWDECSRAVCLRLLTTAATNLCTKSIMVGGQRVTRYALESPMWQRFQTIHVPVYFIEDHAELLTNLIFSVTAVSVHLDIHLQRGRRDVPRAQQQPGLCEAFLQSIVHRLRDVDRSRGFVNLLRCDWRESSRQEQGALHWWIDGTLKPQLEAHGETMPIVDRGPLRTKAYAIDNGTMVFTVLLLSANETGIGEFDVHPVPRYQRIDIRPGRLEQDSDGLYYYDDAVLL